MPCDSVIRMKVEFKVENILTLKTALEHRGYTVTHNEESQTLYFRNNDHSGTFANNQFQITQGRYSQKFDTAALKREYSHVVVQNQARRMGWQLQKTGENKYVVTRRG